MTTATKLLLTCLIIFMTMQIFDDLIDNEYGETVRLFWTSAGTAVIFTGFVSLIAAVWGY